MEKQYPHHSQYVEKQRIRSGLGGVISWTLGLDRGRAYVIIGEEERWWRGRSRLRGLHWNFSKCAGGRDWNLRLLLSLKEILSKQERCIS